MSFDSKKNGVGKQIVRNIILVVFVIPLPVSDVKGFTFPQKITVHWVSFTFTTK